ncbi:MAG: hypothetical protein IJV15_08465, partial [Lachnospiraceae bacterium]|nr:hypothetical protein [Lachnospiraceae bacterium]
EYLLNGFHAAVNAVDRERSAYMKLRYLGDFNLLRDWMMLKQSGVNPGDKFIAKGYKHIAVYGMGDVGKLLIEELKYSDVKVLYSIDRNPRIGYKDVKIYGLSEEEYPAVDAIVVTVAWDMENVLKKLDGKTESEIISIREIF